MDDMPTNEPPPFATMCAAVCFTHSIVPSTFRWRTRRNSWVSWTWYGPIPPPPPAFAMQPSRLPVGSMAFATAAFTSSSFVTSAVIHWTPPPCPAWASIFTAESSSFDSVRPQIVTAAPSAASRAAQARPMPVPAPVTRTAVPSSPPEGCVGVAMVSPVPLKRFVPDL